MDYLNKSDNIHFLYRAIPADILAYPTLTNPNLTVPFCFLLDNVMISPEWTR